VGIGLIGSDSFGFGLIDFSLSTGEAVTGLGVMFSSTVTGSAAPVVFLGGASLTAHGELGMLNSGIDIRNALFETSGPGLFEGVGGALFGNTGARVGQSMDLFTGLRLGALAAGGVKSAKDIYDLASGGNVIRNTFGNFDSNCSQKCF